jgi:hypothetical protein
VTIADEDNCGEMRTVWKDVSRRIVGAKGDCRQLNDATSRVQQRTRIVGAKGDCRELNDATSRVQQRTRIASKVPFL